jgi:hypothetical protein
VVAVGVVVVVVVVVGVVVVVAVSFAVDRRRVVSRDYRDVRVRLDTADSVLLARVRARLEEQDPLVTVPSSEVLRLGLYEMARKMGVA